MVRRIAVFVALIVSIIGFTTVPSSAGSKFFSKSTGTAVDAYWTQIDGTPVGSSEFGNVHIGFLYAYEQSDDYVDVFAFIDDFDCEEGQTPYGGGPHGFVEEAAADDAVEEEEPFEEEFGCIYMGSRFGYGQDMVLTIDKKLSSATLTGTLVVESGGFHGEGGSVVGEPPVEMTWTGVGDLAKQRQTYRYSEDGVTYSFSERSTYRQASVDGFIGGMTFDPDLSGGSMSNFSNTSKERIK